MRRALLSAMLTTSLLVVACDRSTSDTPTTPTPTLDALSGSWRSNTTTTTIGTCSSTTWTITPTTAATATIVYSATCSGIAVNGTGSGTLTGTTLNWTTSGTAANSCSFGLSGTAVPDSAADLRVTYSGTVCGLPVSGTDTLHR